MSLVLFLQLLFTAHFTILQSVCSKITDIFRIVAEGFFQEFQNSFQECLN